MTLCWTPFIMDKAEKAIMDFYERINDPDFDYALLNKSDKEKYHAVIAVCKLIGEKYD